MSTPGTFSNSEKNQIFELLGVCKAATATIHNGFGVALTLSQLDELRDDVTTRIGALATDQIIEVQAIIAAYQPFRFSAMKLTGASAGGTSGMDEDPEAARARLKTLLEDYIPVMHIAESIARRENRPAGAPAISSPIRGSF